MKFHCGFVSILGRPNVGKSTLLNHLVGQKLSITSRKPQTTRHRLLGIKTMDDAQIIYVDTPGLHQPSGHALNRYMVRAATSAIADVNLILFVVESLRWTEDDEWALKKIERAQCPVILIVNKVDKIADKKRLLPFLETLNQKRNFADVMPLSAKKADDMRALQEVIINYLPEGIALFPEEQISDRSERFFAAEIIREKLMRSLGQEVPYALTVEIEEFKLEKELLRIAAIIYVDKPGQKSIVVGTKGEVLKKVGQGARLDMQKMFGHKIFLQLWVKVKSGWSDDEKSLQSLGY
jgi:GTPase